MGAHASALFPAGPFLRSQTFTGPPRLAVENIPAIENNNCNNDLDPIQESTTAVPPPAAAAADIATPETREIQQPPTVPTKRKSKRPSPKSTTGEGRVPNRCPHAHCIFETSDLRTFGEHMRDCHGIKAFLCEHCGKSSARDDNLKAHQKTCNVKLKKDREAAELEAKQSGGANKRKRARVSTRDLPGYSVFAATTESSGSAIPASTAAVVHGIPEQSTTSVISKAPENLPHVPQRATSESPHIEPSSGAVPQQDKQLEKRLDEMMARIAALEEENARLKVENATLQNRLSDKQDELETMEIERDVWQDMCGRLRRKRRTREEESS
ncbi:hypothetical protein AA313_de0206784 [Arthrobotrys entomopaga]|nr:hypothetical protein AA313_de0206784 [Arthrobotrys entomopaga]